MKDEGEVAPGEQAVLLPAHSSSSLFCGERGDGIRVLLVDDEQHEVRLVHELLRDVGAGTFVLTSVGTLREAVEQLTQNRFDVALVNPALPDSTGTNTINRVLETDSSLPVIVLRSADSEDIAISIVRHGAQDFLKGQDSGATLGRALRYAIEHKRTQQQLVFLSQYDHLTGLPNRGLSHDRLTRALERARRTGKLLAVLSIDLDRFRPINDSLGHESGDRLLQNIVERLTACVHSTDTVGRIGGDRFVVLLEQVTAGEQAARVAERMLRALTAPIPSGGIEVVVSASIGIATFPRDGDEVDALLTNADAALSRAKDKGRNNYQFYAPEMNACAYERLALETALRGAVARHEFRLMYQPIRSLHHGRVTAIEALLRWDHPERGAVSPADIIPVMEESGLIVPVGEWVLRTACRQYRTWRARGLPPLRLKLNFSARQLWQPDLVSKIGRVLEEERVHASSLVLEITEGTLMENTESSRQLLSALREMRIQLSVDDFGTGYSSLGYLKRFPINSLKIDRSFVHDLPQDADSAAIVRAIIDMAHHLRLRVIAEGVETPAQLEFLKRFGCDEAQGFFFSRPLAAEQVLEHCLGDASPLPGQ